MSKQYPDWIGVSNPDFMEAFIADERTDKISTLYNKSIENAVPNIHILEYEIAFM